MTPTKLQERGLRVKPLEWRENYDVSEGGFLAYGVGITYHADDYGWCQYRQMDWEVSDNLEAAKAAAEADHAARIAAQVEVKR
jgi:hypothetical protein